MAKKFMALILAMLLVFAVISGCTDQGKESSSAEEAAETAAASENETEITAETDASEAPSGGNTDAESAGGESETASQSETEAPVSTGPEDFSYGLLENGFVDGVTAMDYVEIPDFSKFTIKKSELEPSESEMDEPLSALLMEFSEHRTDRPIEDGDYVNIDYSGKMDGVQFDGGTAQGADVTAGSQEFIDDFLTQIIGHMPGETMDVEVTFPDPYQNNPDFAGKDAVFTVTINYIHEKPEFTDEWVTEHLEDIREYFGNDKLEKAEDIRKMIYDYYYDQNMSRKLYEFISAEVKAKEIPPIMLEMSEKMMNIRMYMNYGMTVQSFIDMGYVTEEELQTSYNEESTAYLFYQAIAEKEGWTDIKAEEYTDLSGSEDIEGLISTYGRGYIARYVLNQRAMEHITGQFTIEE